MLPRGAESQPLVAETGSNAVLDHRFEHASLGLVAHSVQQLTARPYLLYRGKITALVMDTREPVMRELPGHMCSAIALALALLLWCEHGPLANLLDRLARGVS